MKQTEEVEHPNNELQSLISQIHEGSFLHDASTELRKVVEGARLAGKPATLNLSIVITPHGAAVAIDGKITSKIPKMKKDLTFMFVDDENRLVRENPAQGKLKFDVVHKEQAPIVDLEKREPAPIQAVNG